MGLGRLVQLEKSPFVGQAALRREQAPALPAQIVGLEIDWREVEALYEASHLPPQVPATASRVAVPVYRIGASSRQGHVDDVVTDSEEADRACDRRSGSAEREPGWRWK